MLDSEVLPVINGYRERAEFPWPLIKKLAKLRIVGDGIDRYGCPPMSPIAAGLVNMEPAAPSCVTSEPAGSANGR